MAPVTQVIQYGSPTKLPQKLLLGDAFLGTAHSVNTTIPGANPTVTFSFNGTGVSIYGMFAALWNNGVDEHIPTWECFIDDVPIASNKAFGSFPWLSYCESNNLTDSEHVLTFKPVQSSDATALLWIDFIQYIPSPSDVPYLDQAYVVVNTDDPEFPLDGDSWQPLGSSMMILGNGALFWNFTGVSLIWYSLSLSAIQTLNLSLLEDVSTVETPVALNHAVVGEQRPVQFTIPSDSNLIDSTFHTYNQILFQTAKLSAGSHKLVVTNSPKGFPFTLDYLIIQTGPSISRNPQASSVGSIPYKKKDNIGAVVGGALGGLVVSIVLVLLLVYWKRRRSIIKSQLESIFDSESMREMKIEAFKISTDQKANVISNDHDPASMGRSMTGKSTLSMTPTPAISSTNEPSHQSQPRAPSVISPRSSSSLQNIVDPFIDPDTLKNPEIPVPFPMSDLSTQPIIRLESTLDHNHLALPSYDTQANASEESHSGLTRDGRTLQFEDGLHPLSERTDTNSLAFYSRSSSRSRVWRHADSGIRLSQMDSPETILELPPKYTME